MTYKEHMDQEYNRGLEDGIEIGVAKGEAKGEAKGKISGRVIARYEDGMPIAEIANKSGISEDEVKTILKDEGLIWYMEFLQDVRRSNFHMHLASLVGYEVITIKDLDGFSDETKEIIERMLRWLMMDKVKRVVRLSLLNKSVAA